MTAAPSPLPSDRHAPFDAAPPAESRLLIDLGALAWNYRRLAREVAPAECAAVVKADAYGLGLAQVAPVLHDAGARTFFVAQLAEAIRLRDVLGTRPATIYVLNGLLPGAEPAFLGHDVRPVLNCLEALARWREAAGAAHRPLPAALHLDTGMRRLGLSQGELLRLLAQPDRLEGVPLAIVMSHLASAEDPETPQNADQLALFQEASRAIPAERRSLANSPGIFLGSAYHYDLARPGVALYGGNPTPGRPNPMRPVVRLQGRVLQVRHEPAGLPVGYGATYVTTRPTRIATVSVGYADGYPRGLSNHARAFLGAHELRQVGRISMDLATFDATEVPEAELAAGTWIELLGDRYGVDEMAADAGTISYELLTSLGQRFERHYSSA